MTHIRVTTYVECWLVKSVMSLHPGVFTYTLVKDMFGDEFVRDRLADGTMVAVNQEEIS